MSVTFTFATYIESEAHGTILVMGTDHNHRAPETCCDDAAIYLGCCDHSEAAREPCGCEAYDVNLANANAAAILERLGYPHDFEDGLSGSTDPDDFLGRVLVGNVGRDDSGVPMTQDDTPGGACFIDCGVRPGYYDDRMASLAALATEAKVRGCMIAWG